MACLSKKDRIFVAGHSGLVGSSLVQVLRERGYRNLILRTHKELDLCDSHAVRSFFKTEHPDVVFLAAAKVGGIFANDSFRADFIQDNLQIQTHVISSAHQFGTHRLIFLGSSCIYPREAPQPIKETDLLTGPLEFTNRPYAIAKLAGLEFIDSLRRQAQRDYFSVMPTNLYGPQDNFHPLHSHVLPALIRRFWEAKNNQEEKVEIWGTGKPLREFMFSLDCAEAIVFLAEKLSFEQLENSFIGKAGWSHINIGSGQEVSIAELGNLISELIGFSGKILFDPTRPDGTPRKFLDCRFLQQLGWKPKYQLKEGIQETLSWIETQFKKKHRFPSKPESSLRPNG